MRLPKPSGSRVAGLTLDEDMVEILAALGRMLSALTVSQNARSEIPDLGVKIQAYFCSNSFIRLDLKREDKRYFWDDFEKPKA